MLPKENTSEKSRFIQNLKPATAAAGKDDYKRPRLLAYQDMTQNVLTTARQWEENNGRNGSKVTT